MEKEGTVKSFDMARSMRFQGKFRERDFIDRNVVALLEGGHPKLKRTCLVLSAHYDHLGLGPEVRGDRIYNGVLDNAVGVAALLELARVFAKNRDSLNRSLVFLFTTGEEKGLLGATYYVENPVFELHKTVANINIDGLAVDDTFDDMFAFGASYSTLENFIRIALAELDLKLSEIPHFVSQADSFARSDQMAFARVGIPSVILVEGFQRRHQGFDSALARWVAWQNHVYHTPFDDLNQTIEIDACMQHLCALYIVARELAQSKRAPKWHPGSRFAHERLLTEAENR